MSVVIVVSDRILASRLQRATPREVVSLASSASLEDVLESVLTSGTGSVLVIGPDVELARAFELVDIVHQQPEPLPVLLARESPESVGPIHGESGILEVFDTNADDAILVEVLGRLAPVSLGFQSRQGHADTRRIIVTLSPKGGVGKTTISSNLAVELANRSPLNVVLVDYDSQFGDVTSAFNLIPAHTIEDAFTQGGIQGSLVVQGLLNIVNDRLFVLGGSDSPAAMEKVSGAQLRNLLSQLADDYGSIVVDTSAGINDATLAALEVATDVVLVSTMDVSTIRSLRRSIDLLDKLLLLPSRRYLVVNMIDEEIGLTVEDVSSSLHMPVLTAIPRSPEIAFSMNVGEPMAQRRKPSDLQFAVREIADAIGGEPMPNESRFNLGRLWNRGRR